MSEHVLLDRKERFRKLDPIDKTLGGDHLDIPARTKVKVVECEGGMYLLEHEGFHGRVWASFVTRIEK